MENADQREFWSDTVGDIWVDQRAAMDAVLAPVLDAVLDRAGITKGQHILDIGCGAGTSSIIAAKQAGSGGKVIGADISQTLLNDARARGADQPNLHFDLVDAQSHGFSPASVDLIMSRFGVMFFNDPVAAFVNMAQALKPAGKIVFATWGVIPENPFFTLPARVSTMVLGPREKTDPDAPGPFSMRDIDGVVELLKVAGFEDVSAQAIAMKLPFNGSAQALSELMCQIGPAQSALQHFDADAQQRQALIAALSEALGIYKAQGGFEIPALINLFSARKP